MSEIADWSLVEAADAIAARRVSAVEVTKAALARIGKRQPRLNCFVRVDRQRRACRAGRALDTVPTGRPRCAGRRVIAV